MNDFVEAFHFVFDRWDNLINQLLIDHLILCGKAMLIAVLIGVPIGVLLGHIHRFSFLAINISNIGRALPSVGVLAIGLPIVGIGDTNVIVALIILAAPPILTNSYVAVDQVDADTVDAAKGIGLKWWQILFGVELPLGLPLIFAGVRTSAVFVVATATLAGFFGGGGLGDIISNRASYGLDGVVGASYVLIVLAFVSQGLFILLERLVTPAGLRQGRRTLRSRLTPNRGNLNEIETSADQSAGVRDDYDGDDDVASELHLEKGRSV
jgi:osmoprotectant transport system permease protein